MSVGSWPTDKDTRAQNRTDALLRERDKMRQRNSRLARKYGLRGRRERG